MSRRKRKGTRTHTHKRTHTHTHTHTHTQKSTHTHTPHTHTHCTHTHTQPHTHTQTLSSWLPEVTTHTRAVWWRGMHGSGSQRKSGTHTHIRLHTHSRCAGDIEFNFYFAYLMRKRKAEQSYMHRGQVNEYYLINWPVKWIFWCHLSPNPPG